MESANVWVSRNTILYTVQHTTFNTVRKFLVYFVHYGGEYLDSLQIQTFS
jgi:hypothetical protein